MSIAPKTWYHQTKVSAQKGFTLVELIVVISILVILGTIGFLSVGSYLASARDTVRISDISHLAVALDWYKLRVGGYPSVSRDFPNKTVTYLGSEVFSEGVIWDSFIRILGSIVKTPVDPKYTSVFYDYWVLSWGRGYQIGSILEDPAMTSFSRDPSLITEAYAAATIISNDTVYIQWDYKWVTTVFTWDVSMTGSLASLITSDTRTGSMDISTIANATIGAGIFAAIGTSFSGSFLLSKSTGDIPFSYKVAGIGWGNVWWYGANGIALLPPPPPFVCSATQPVVTGATPTFNAGTPSVDQQAWVYDASLTTTCSWTCPTWFNKWTGNTCTPALVAYWNGTTSTAWATASNWSWSILPTLASDIIINAAVTYQPILDLTSWSITFASITLGSSATAMTLTVSNSTPTNSLNLTKFMTVGSKWTLTHTANATTKVHTLALNVQGNLTINTWWKIDVSSKGYAGGTGGGNGWGWGGGIWSAGGSGWWGAYGGNGGSWSVAGWTAYGSWSAPTDLWSGWGASWFGYIGWVGWGAIKLIVSGTTTVSGSILANGWASDTYSWGWAWGSIWLTTGTFTGNGAMSANGWNAWMSNGWGGWWGRIKINVSSSGFTGTKTVTGGTGYQAGGVGSNL